MPSIFHALNNGYTGLATTQTAINTVGHNIANAETEGYTRQRVALSASTPLDTPNMQLGSGVRIDEIARIHDEFVFKRLKGSQQQKEFSQFSRKTLEEISTLFPEIDDVGIKNNFHSYMNAWAAVAQDFNNISQKSILAQETKNFTDSIQEVRKKLVSMQVDLNDQLAVNVEEINRMAKEIADTNSKINVAEAVTDNAANDLRDKRDRLESAISKLIDTTVTKYNLRSNTPMDTNINDRTTSYNLSIGGFSIVDGATFHEIKLDTLNSANGMYTMMYERQDGYKFDMTNAVKAGKLGAIVNLRGDKIDAVTALPANGKIQEYINRLDSFAATLITSTNNVYATSAIDEMHSLTLDLPEDASFAESELPIKKGSFDLIMYDVDGNEKGRRTVKVDGGTTMTYGAKSVLAQLNANVDDNANRNELDDFDDKFIAHYVDGQLSITAKTMGQQEGYTIAIEDRGTNFAGAIGLHRFFDGTDATNITLKREFHEMPARIKAYGRADEGNNEVANRILQLQHNKVEFDAKGGKVLDTFSNFFDGITAEIAGNTSIAITKDETYTAQLNAIEKEYDAISKVSVDEELTQLIKYQTAYGANAKVITTVDQMINTLLGIKQ
ncbi:MAG: hypothetical protein KU37_07530 [Sulfuricurvum sp. PC08-66]|nr:MAG: hypothetical protein KU37_07530 [Sulfuricurvum sp. PC08-66]